MIISHSNLNKIDQSSDINIMLNYNLNYIIKYIIKI